MEYLVYQDGHVVLIESEEDDIFYEFEGLEHGKVVLKVRVKMKSSVYRKPEDHPQEITISSYYSNGVSSYLRQALPDDHEENLWNWFRRTYPDLNPEYYDIYDPVELRKQVSVRVKF